MDEKQELFEIAASLCTFLTVIFFGLKLTKAIDWSWWWVFSPFWIPVLILSIIIAVGALIEHHE